MYVSKWLCIPTRMSQLTQAVYDWFQVGPNKKSNHCKSFYGATVEIHDDIVYDYLSRWQMSQGGFASVRIYKTLLCSVLLSQQFSI